MIVLLMGAAGSGKSTVACRLAARLGCPFLDADRLHDAASKTRMALGMPLREEDRGPWLEAVNGVLAQHSAAGQDLVLACSALRRSHRAALGQGVEPLRIVFLDGEPPLLERRIREREGHFFPAELLADQLAILEPPDDERALRLNVSETPERLVEQILAWLPAAEGQPGR